MSVMLIGVKAVAKSLLALPPAAMERWLEEKMLAKAIQHEAAVVDTPFGEEVLALGRSIVGNLDESRRGQALQILKKYHNELDVAKFAITVQHIENVDTDKDDSDLLWAAEEAVRAVAALYENRGKKIVEMMWILLKLKVRIVPGTPPHDAYTQLHPMISSYQIAGGDCLKSFTQWHHWRNAAYHEGCIELVPLGEPPHIIVRDKKSDGTQTYCDRFTVIQSFAMYNRADDFLGRTGAYRVVIEALISELEFQGMSDAQIRASIKEALTPLEFLLKKLND